MFEYLYNDTKSGLDTDDNFYTKALDVPNITMTGYLVNARRLVAALRAIDKSMGSFPVPSVKKK
jgi:hypothetical protein